MKKGFYWVSIILQVVLFITAISIQVFSMKKMGMMRHVVYMNHQWEAQYPMATLRYITIAFLVVVSAGIIFYTFTKKSNCIKNKKALLGLAALAVITFAFVFFTLSYSTDNYRSYYFTGLILAIITLIQDIKLIVQLKSLDKA